MTSAFTSGRGRSGTTGTTRRGQSGHPSIFGGTGVECSPGGSGSATLWSGMATRCGPTGGGRSIRPEPASGVLEVRRPEVHLLHRAGLAQGHHVGPVGWGLHLADAEELVLQ